MSAEIMRLLENMIRVGVISDVDLKNWRVRVTSGRLTTDWLRWNCTRAGVFKIWLPPSRGEQVLLLCPGGNPEMAMVVGSLYSTDNPALEHSRMKSSSLPEMVQDSVITQRKVPLTQQG